MRPVFHSLLGQVGMEPDVGEYAFETPAASLKEKIIWYQTILKVANGEPDLVVDGQYGTRTIRAINRFQKRHNLLKPGTEGRITPQMNYALNQAALEHIYREKIPNKMGVWGPSLVQKLRAFQRFYKLEPDGKVGPATRAVTVKVLEGSLPPPFPLYHPKLGPGRLVPRGKSQVQTFLVSYEEEVAPQDQMEYTTGDLDYQVPNTLDAPFRWICRILPRFPDPDSARDIEFGRGTGFLVSPRHVLTAAHVIHSSYTGSHGTISEGAARRIEVGPGFDANRTFLKRPANKKRWIRSKYPFGKFVGVSGRVARNYLERVKNDPYWRKSNYDYGMIQLARAWKDVPFEFKRTRRSRVRRVPNDWWGRRDHGLTVRTLIKEADVGILGKKARFSGYPKAFQVQKSGTVRGVDLRYTKEVFIDAFVWPGHSGSPVWIEEPEGSESARLRLIGIATRQCGVTNQQTCGRLLDKGFLNDLATWIIEM